MRVIAGIRRKRKSNVLAIFVPRCSAPIYTTNIASIPRVIIAVAGNPNLTTQPLPTDHINAHVEYVIKIAAAVMKRRDDDAESEALYYLCKLVKCPGYPRDKDADEQRKYIYVCIKQYLQRWNMKRIKRKASMYSETPLEELSAGPIDVPEGIQRELESEAASAELAEYKEAHQPGNFSRKQWMINKARRKRLYGESAHGTRSPINV